MPPRNNKSAPATTGGGSEPALTKTWDHSALAQRSWLYTLCKTLEANPRHSSFVSGAYCSASKGLTAVYSAEQAADIVDGSIRALRHDMTNPMPADTYLTTLTIMPDELKKRFIIAPEVLEDQARELLSDITVTMMDDGCAAEYRSACDNHPCTLLINLHLECASISDNASGKAARDMANLFLRGPVSADVPAFNAFKTEIDSLNRTVKLADRIDNPTLASKLIRSVNLLGREVRNDLKAEVRHLKMPRTT